MRKPARARSFLVAARAGILLVLCVGIADADPRSRPFDPQATDVGRQRFVEGVAALKKGKYEDARISFQQSYALKPVPPALRNLAATELKTGRYVEAARHFTQYLKTTKSTEIERADLVEQGLDEAKVHCGVLFVETNVPGAEIAVDGEIIGKTPLGRDPWFVEPGEHVIVARLEGYDEHTEKQRLEAGRTARIFLALRPSGVDRASSPLPAAPAETLPAFTNERWPERRAEPPNAMVSTVAGRDDAHVRVAPLVAGGVLTAAGLGVGIGYTVAAGATLDRRDEVLGSIPGPSPKCGSGTPYAIACDEVLKLDQNANRHRYVATAGYVVAGIAGAATLVYWLWPRASRSPQGVVVPAFAPAYAGIHVESRF